MLQLASKWAEQEFTSDSRPCQQTIYKWIDEGIVPGRKMNNAYYVDLTKWRKQTGNSLLDKILES